MCHLIAGKAAPCRFGYAHQRMHATAHLNIARVNAGENVLRPPTTKGAAVAEAPVSCVAISSCGNFGLVGSAGGHVDRYNMQSGLHRGNYSRCRGVICIELCTAA